MPRTCGQWLFSKLYLNCPQFVLITVQSGLCFGRSLCSPRGGAPEMPVGIPGSQELHDPGIDLLGGIEARFSASEPPGNEDHGFQCRQKVIWK